MPATGEGPVLPSPPSEIGAHDFEIAQPVHSPGASSPNESFATQSDSGLDPRPSTNQENFLDSGTSNMPHLLGNSQNDSVRGSTTSVAKWITSELRTDVRRSSSDHSLSRGSSNFVTNFIHTRQCHRGRFADMIWNFLEEPESSEAAFYYAKLMPLFILLSVFSTMLQSVKGVPFQGLSATAAESTVESVYAFEIALRFVTCPNRWMFLLDPYNLIDFGAAAPLILRCAAGFSATSQDTRGLSEVVLLGFVPTLRLLKMLRRFQKIHLLFQAFRLAFEALPVLLFTYLFLVFVFTALIFAVEPIDNVDSFWRAMWLTIVSMTTLGYGDLIPQSSLGTCIISVLVVTSTLYMAIPLGIIGDCFSQVWKDRDRILLMQRLRRRLEEWGYKAHDLPKLFRSFNSNSSGSINLTDFCEMVKQLRLGLRPGRVIQLFEMLDDNASGTIDDSEFVRALFPGAWHQLFAQDGQPKAVNAEVSLSSYAPPRA